MKLGRTLFVVFLCGLAVVVCVWSGRLFLAQIGRTVPLVTECEDQAGRHLWNAANSEPYLKCRKELATTFYDRDYAETRDISKAFLTLLTALFVASITFSEKIVNVNTAGWWPRALMICCWVLLLVSITSCGSALALMMLAAGYASYSPETNFFVFEADAVKLYLLSGLAFGTALALLLVAGIIALVDGRWANVTSGTSV